MTPTETPPPPLRFRRALSLGMSSGALLFMLLFATGVASLLQLRGDPDPDSQQVMERFAEKIFLTLGRIALVHLWIGVLLGGLCGMAVRVLWPRMHRPALFGASVTAILMGLAAYLTARLLIHQPTFFDSFLFAQGGRARQLQLFLTHELGRTGLRVLGWSTLGVLLLCSPSVRALIPRGWPRTRAQRFGASLGVVALLAFGLRNLWSPPTPAAPDEKPNILLISVDSLRPDHLSCNGYHRATTPNIDRLAERSRVFDQAYVPMARTLSSWTSLLTSTDPHTHGIRHMFPEADRHRLAVPALPEVLAREGYQSAVVSDFAGEMFQLIDFGFDRVDTPPASDVNVLVERQMLLHFPMVFPFINHRVGKRVLPVVSYLTINSDAEALAEQALRRMRELADRGPFLATVFFSTAHVPYAAPWPYYDRFTDADYEGDHHYAYGMRDPRQFAEGAPQMDDADRRQVVALYDGALAHVDAAIGMILDELEDWGYLDSTLVILTADHGEHLFECGDDADHGKWFRGGDSANQVPLIVWDPAGELGEGHVPELVRSLELMPTLLGRLGIEVPPSCEGHDLSAALAAGEPLPELRLQAETGVWLKAPTTFGDEDEALIYPHVNDILDAAPHDETLFVAPPFDELVVRAKHRMIRDDRFKLVYEPTREAVRWALHDVEWDPLNRINLAAQRESQRREYAALLREWMARDPLRRMDDRGHLVPYFTQGE